MFISSHSMELIDLLAQYGKRVKFRCENLAVPYSTYTMKVRKHMFE